MSAGSDRYLQFYYAAGLGLIAVALFAMSALKPIDHDEHQFIASAATLARSGWLPYRDAPYHHLPYLSFLYAALFSCGGSLLASARTVCVVASLGIVALTASAVVNALGERPARVRALAATIAAVVLISNPLFVYTSGRAWNHDVPLLLTLAAALAHMKWLEGTQRRGIVFAAGLLLGAAIGTRSSFALTIPAFAASFLLLGKANPRQRVRAVVAFAAGGFLALLPVALLFSLAPEQFLFGNLRYNLELNTEYRRMTGWTVAMDFGGKLDYVRTELLSHRRNGLLFWLYPLALLSAAYRGRLRQHASTHTFIALMLLMLLFAAWSPTPAWYQYFFALVPFLLVGAALAIGAHDGPRTTALPLLAVLLLTLTSVAGLRHYIPALRADAQSSRTDFVRRVADELSAVSQPGRVATLGPLFALEAGREIYPSLATGAFSWRTAPLVTPEERSTLGLVGPEELAAMLDSAPPAAILVGVEQDDDAHLETAFIEYARGRGYEAHALSDGMTAWVPPAGRGADPPALHKSREALSR